MLSNKQFLIWATNSIIFLLLIFAVSLLFRAYPEIDIEVSKYFFIEGWYVKSIPFYAVSRDVGRVLPVLLYFFFLGYINYLIFANAPKVFIPLKVAIFGFLSFSASTILIVNLLFKNNWGRSRPISVDIFYGHNEFSLPWSITDNCVNNCSFVSGEASAIFWMLFMTIFLPKQYRKFALFLGVIFASYIAFLRVMFGAHFLSDVILGALVTLLITSIIYIWLFIVEPLWAKNQLLEKNLNNFGNRLKIIFGKNPS